MNCSNCGNALNPGDRFCTECGSGVVSEVDFLQPDEADSTSERLAGQQSFAGSASVFLETGRRTSTLILLVIGEIASVMGVTLFGALALLAALTAYISLPRIVPPEGAYTYERMPAVVMPDVLGFLMVSFFFGMPFFAKAFEGARWVDLLTSIHPSALLTWPMALFSVTILFVANGYANYWLKVEGKGLRIHSAKGEEFVHFEDISMAVPHRRDFAYWLRWLAPLLVLNGKYTAAGSALLARAETGMTLEKRDGTKVTILSDAFETPFKKIVKALRKHQVSVSEELNAILTIT